MSNNVLTTSTNRCFLAGTRQRVLKDRNKAQISYKNLVQSAFHRLTGVVFEESQTWGWRRL